MVENSIKGRILVLLMTAGRTTNMFEEDTDIAADRRYL